jgi:hypothetical protein
MIENIRPDLIRVSNYAKSQGRSTTWVYQKGREGAIKLVKIDGVKFVKVA